MWLGLQNKYDIAKALLNYGDDIERIQTFVWPTDPSETGRLAA